MYRPPYPSSIALDHNIEIDSKSFERMEQFRYFGAALANQNSVHEETKSKLKSGNACYQSAQNLLPSSSLSKNIKITIYRTIILSVVLYGSGAWSVTLREERRLRVFERRVLRKMFGLKRDEVTGEWRWLHNEELNDLYWSPNIIRVIKSRRIRWAGHVARMGNTRCAYRVLAEGGLRKRGHLEDPGVDGRIIFK
jgi:hypothetical protein